MPLRHARFAVQTLWSHIVFSQIISHLRQSLEASKGPQRLAERVEVCPPSLGRTAPGHTLGLRAWIATSFLDSTSATPHRAQHQPVLRATPLAAVRDEFVAAIAGTGGNSEAGLADRINTARSLRELWHLRTDVYTLVATQVNEAEAQQRLLRLNRHFPTRANRSATA